MQHNRDKDYYELLALNILNDSNLINKAKFKKGEKPDWQSTELSEGIEVTRDERNESFDNFINNSNINNIKNVINYNKKFKKHGGRIISEERAKCIFGYEYKNSKNFHHGFLYIIPSYTDSFEEIHKIHKLKLFKLNNGYNKDLKLNILFIFSNIYIDNKKLMKEMKIFNKNSKEYKRIFNKIYVYADKIYSFDLFNYKLDIIEPINYYKIIENTLEELNEKNS